MDKLKKWLKQHHKNPWLYLIISFTFTWLFLFPAVLLEKAITNPIIIVLIALGGIFGKMIPPVMIPYLVYGEKGWRDYWQRLIDFKRMGLKWGVISLSLPVIFVVMGIITGLFFGENIPSLEMTNIFKIIPYGFFILIYGPLPEEMGWTGYELDRLQARFSALNSGLILGFFWLLWHLPLFFIIGSYQKEIVGFNTMRFWFTFVPGIISLQVLQVWLYNNTNRSIMPAVGIHFMTNFSGEMLDLSIFQEYMRIMWAIVFTIIIVIIWGQKSLNREKEILDFKNILSHVD